VELIDGSLFDRPPISQCHAGVVNALNRALVLACGDRAIVSIQTPAQLDWFSEPRPDATLFRPRTDNDRSDAPPGPAAILLVVEVADSTPRYDRAVKLPLYARRALPRCASSICPARGRWSPDTGRRRIRDGRVARPGRHGHAEFGAEDRGGLAPGLRVRRRTSIRSSRQATSPALRLSGRAGARS